MKHFATAALQCTIPSTKDMRAKILKRRCKKLLITEKTLKRN